MILRGYLFSLLYGIACILVSMIVGKLGVKSVYTRKITHILIGIEWVILEHYLGASIHFVIICLIFTAIISVIYITNLVPSLSSDEENSRGTIYYCLAMTVMSIVLLFIPDMMVPFGVSVFCTSFGDGFAGVFGQIKKYNRAIWGKKTLLGFIACFVFSLLSVILISKIYGMELKPYYGVIIALFAAQLELFAKDGMDNISVTLGASFLTFALANYSTFILYYICPILLILPTVMLVNQKRALTRGGIIAALVLAIIASLAFGNTGFIILIFFFGGSLLSDKLKAGQKSREQRTVVQVLANGGLGIIFALFQLIFPSEIWLVAFASVFAEALADTVASGIGSRAKKTFDPVRMRSVASGVSGGMSLLGTASSLVASSLLSCAVLIFGKIDVPSAFIVATAGFLGAIFDSLSGSLLQGKYRCPVCGKDTESKKHCGADAKRISGISWIDNSMVNLFGTAFASALSIVLYLCF